MSKINKRKEIKQKEDFQLRFQLALSASNDKVLSWLPNSDSSSIVTEGVPGKDKHSFLDLPVLPNGAGLSELDDASKSFGTIGSFVNAETLPKGQKAAPASREIRTGSKAMSALMNRMRTDKRNSLSKSGNNIRNFDNRRRSKMMDELKHQKQSKKLEPASSAPEVDSDEEESKAKQISAKPKIPQVGKKGKGRPF